jgi:predicted Zn-dependent protease/TolB-like protein
MKPPGWAASCALGCAILVAAASAAPQPPAARERLLVVPFENLVRDGRYSWVSEAAAILVADTLEACGVATFAREQRLEAFERLQLPPSARLTEATIIRLGQSIGAAQVVLGSFTVTDGQLAVKARSIRLDSGRVRPPAEASGPLADFFAVFERLSRQILPPALTVPDRLDVDHGTLPVFENYVKGLVAETTAARVRFLQAALALAPAYTPARLALWQVHSAEGDHARAAAAVLAVPADSRAYRPSRFLAALSKIRLRQHDEAFSMLKALLDQAPTPAIYNNLGVVQARRGATTQAGRATYFFTKAAESDPEDPDYAFNLGYAYWFERDPQAALYWLKEAVRRNPADGDAHFVLAAVLTAVGATVEAGRERDLARQLSSTYEEWERRPNAAVEPVPKGLERVREEMDAPRLSLVATALAPAEQKDQRDLAAFHADRGRRLYEQQQDQAAVEELRRSLYLAPYQPDVHLLLGRLYLRTGRAPDAIRALKISLWSRDGATAHAVLGEAYVQAKDLVRARTELQAALRLDPEDADAKQLAAKLEGRVR